jgi:hypothetical protein
MPLEPKTRVSPGRPELANDAGRHESAPILRRCQADLTPNMLPHHHTRVKADSNSGTGSSRITLTVDSGIRKC